MIEVRIAIGRMGTWVCLKAPDRDDDNAFILDKFAEDEDDQNGGYGIFYKGEYAPGGYRAKYYTMPEKTPDYYGNYGVEGVFYEVERL